MYQIAAPGQQVYACKIKKVEGEISHQDIDEFVNEFNTNRYLQKEAHPHILTAMGVGRGNRDRLDGSEPVEVIYQVLEFAKHGELFGIVKSTGKFSEPTAKHFFRQIISALYHMHNVYIYINIYISY